MNYDEKKKRLSVLASVPPVAGLDHRQFLDKDGNLSLLSNLSRKERRINAAGAKKLGAQYVKIQKNMLTSGAGFPVDQLLRELAIGYTHRYASSGIYNQPVSFNYFESFCNVRLIENSVAPYAEPISEMDHLFNLTDFFDYLTSTEAEGFDLSSLLELPESKVLHFTTNGDVLDLSFLNAEGREFVISGFSMVRRRNSLHWYLLGGEFLSREEWKLRSTDQPTVELKNVTPWKRAFLSESMAENDYKVGAPVALEGTDTAVRTVAVGEVDLTTKKYLGRCLMSETENSFSITCDDPDIVDAIRDDKKRQDMIDAMMERISQAAVMWDLVGALFQLPSYFSYKVHIKKDMVVAADRQVRPIKSGGGRGLRARYKTVSSIDIVDSDLPIVRPILPPHYNTETEGHWRRLPHGSMGKGPDGSPEPGRTWVKATNNWRETPAEPRTIYVKSTIKAAKLKAKEYEDAAQSIKDSSQLDGNITNTDFGELYVLRCVVMQEELYKVGWTSGSSTERAGQLSSATGVPTSFVVVDCWKHEDAAALEKSVHAMLEPYRVNDRREFFHASYNTIKKIIEAEIERFERKHL